MNIFGVGLPEVTVILILALIIFGPKKLPELGKQLGKTLKSLKKASNEFQNEIDQVINESEKEDLTQSPQENYRNNIDQLTKEREKQDSSKSDGMKRKLLDTSKITKLGWKPKINLENGMKSYYESVSYTHLTLPTKRIV